MPSTLDDQLTRLDELHESLEALRSRLTDLDAMAHAAVGLMDSLPFVPRQSDTMPAWTEEQRRNLGRMQALVFSTAEAAESALTTIDAVIDDLEHGFAPKKGGGSAPAGGSPEDASRSNGTPGDDGSKAHAAVLPRSRAGIALDLRPTAPSVP